MRRRSALLVALAAVVATMSLAAAPARAVQSFALLTKWGSTGSGPGQFDIPADVAVDATGNVFVADSANHRVQKFGPDGTFLTSFNRTNVGPFNPTTLGIVMAVAVSADAVYAKETGFNGSTSRIVKYTLGGFFLAKWSVPANTSIGSPPEDLAVDAAGNVYVIANNTDVFKYSSSGALLAQLASGLQHPTGIAVDASGGIFVLDGVNERLVKLNGRGATLLNNPIPGIPPFTSLRGLGLDPTGRLWTGDGTNDRMVALSQTGAVLATFGSLGTGDLQFDAPNGAAANEVGILYVADAGNDRVQKVTEATTLTVVYNTDGEGSIDSSYQASGPSGSQSFSLDDDADPTLSDTKVLAGLVPGVYHVASIAGPYIVKSIFCSNGVQIENSQASAVDVTLLAGGSVTCTFYEEWIG